MSGNTPDYADLNFTYNHEYEEDIENVNANYISLTGAQQNPLNPLKEIHELQRFSLSKGIRLKTMITDPFYGLASSSPRH